MMAINPLPAAVRLDLATVPDIDYSRVESPLQKG
jgi:hypothetical protein